MDGGRSDLEWKNNPRFDYRCSVLCRKPPGGNCQLPSESRMSVSVSLNIYPRRRQNLESLPVNEIMRIKLRTQDDG